MRSANVRTLQRRDREPLPIPDSLAADRWVRTVILAAGYTLTGIVGLTLAIPPGYATAVWPPSGIALAALLLWGPRVWPGIAIGSVLVNVAVALSTAGGEFTGLSVVIALSIAVGSTVQTLACAAAIQRWVGVSQIFEAGPATLLYTAVAAVACLVASSWGVATLNVAGVVQADQFLDSWQTWWLGDLIGILVFAPVFLTWRQSLHIAHRRWRLGELGVAFALLTVTTLVVFFAPAPGDGVASPLTFLPLPALVWIAFRFRPSGVAIAVALLSLIAIAATANGSGPFGGERTTESLLALQAFIGLTAVMALTLAAAGSGRRQAEHAPRQHSGEGEPLALPGDL